MLACIGTIVSTLSILLVPIGSGGLVSEPAQSHGDEEDGVEGTRYNVICQAFTRMNGIYCTVPVVDDYCCSRFSVFTAALHLLAEDKLPFARVSRQGVEPMT